MMEAMQPAEASSARPVVAQTFPSSVVIIAIAALALGLGLHVGVWVNTARPEDASILGLIPWLAFPGIVAAIAVRSRVEMLATGVAAAVPVAMFATLYGADRVRDMGLGVPLGYATLILISVAAASWFARRPGPQWLIGAMVGGGVAFLLALGLTLLMLTLPIFL